MVDVVMTMMMAVDDGGCDMTLYSIVCAFIIGNSVQHIRPFIYSIIHGFVSRGFGCVCDLRTTLTLRTMLSSPLTDPFANFQS